MKEVLKKPVQTKSIQVNEHFGNVCSCFGFMIIPQSEKDET